jgi:hypothetical protein
MNRVIILLICLMLISTQVFAYTPRQVEQMDSFISFAEFIGLPLSWYPQEVLTYMDFKEQVVLYKQSVLFSSMLQASGSERRAFVWD